MEYKQSIHFAQQGILGEFGLLPYIYKDYKCRIDAAADSIKSDLTAHILAPFSPLYDPSLMNSHSALIEKYKRFKTVLIVGTGGSTLGAQSLYNLYPEKSSIYPELIFLDNIDSKTINTVLSQICYEETGVFIVSKSGKTIETICLTLILADSYKNALGTDSLEKYFAVLTEHTYNPLHKFALSHKMVCLPHDQKIGGRFSIFANVALIPAAFCGLDIEAFCAGGRWVLDHFLKNIQIYDNAPLYGAFFVTSCLQEKAISNHVIMPYIDRLRGFVRWYKQLCAESLGKNGGGLTPIDAFGTIDQHSQLQLYLEGPADKLFTIIINGNHQGDMRISNHDMDEFRFLHNKSLDEIMSSQQNATISALVKKKRPVRVISLPSINEKKLGILSAHFILEVIITARLLHINPFDQPAVDEGKEMAYKELTRAAS